MSFEEYTHEEIQTACIPALQEVYKSSLYATCKLLLGYKDITQHTHGPMIEALESPSKRKLLCVPRGCFKSSIGVVGYTIWSLMRNPNERILIDSEVYANSKNFMREIKAHLASPLFTSIFGNWKSDINWNEGEITINCRTQPFKEASVTCGGIGTIKVGQHYSCITAKTKVLTSKGYLLAQDIRLGMRLLTSDGHFRTLRAIQKRPHEGDLIGFKVLGEYDTNWVTPDHKILIKRGLKIEWMEAKDLRKGDFCATPLIQGRTRVVSRSSSFQNELLTNDKFWRFIGFWLAEGCRSPNNEVRLSFGSHEPHYAEEVVNLLDLYGIRASIRKTESSTLLVRFANPDVKEILNRFGTRATDKRIPVFALNTYSNRQRELIKAYIQGDGSRSINRYCASSVSENLIVGLRLMLSGLGIPSIAHTTKAKTQLFNIQGRQYYSHAKQVYAFSAAHPFLSLIMGDIPIWQNKPIRSHIDPDIWWRPIKELDRKQESTEVYDFNMNVTHDFYIPGAIVHNCIIGDDLNSGNNSSNQEARKKVIQHYQMNQAILEPEGTYVVIGTRYAADDLIGWILENEILQTMDSSA